MSNKKAFIFDTNFIIHNKRLDRVVENLKDEYNIYVTQVSIDERIAQKCREIKENYDEVEHCIKEHDIIATIQFKITYEEYCQTIESALQKNYNNLFGDRIIPYYSDGDTLDIILKRANKKEPPFSSAKNASDKGFKDCLLWLSLLEYFKTNGETEVVFVSEDGGFKDNSDYLCDEFRKITGKNIVIKPNSYYNELLESEKEELQIKKSEPLPDFSLLRDRIQKTLYDLCFVVSEDYWGNEIEEPVFLLSEKADELDAIFFFTGLGKTVHEHILEKDVPTEVVFSTLESFSPVMHSVSINTLERALRLYEEIQEKYSEYENQFYNAVVNMFNRNYAEPKDEVVIDGDDLPF